MKNSVYRLSFSYYLRAFIFLGIIVFNFVFTINNIRKYNYIVLFLLAIISIYIIYYIYTVLSFKIILNETTLINGKIKVDLKNIDEMYLTKRLIARKLEECLVIIEGSNRYIVRLNISKKEEFLNNLKNLSKKNIEDKK